MGIQSFPAVQGFPSSPTTQEFPDCPAVQGFPGSPTTQEFPDCPDVQGFCTRLSRIQNYLKILFILKLQRTGDSMQSHRILDFWPWVKLNCLKYIVKKEHGRTFPLFLKIRLHDKRMIISVHMIRF